MVIKISDICKVSNQGKCVLMKLILQKAVKVEDDSEVRKCEQYN
jgi:hypothetical protein